MKMSYVRPIRSTLFAYDQSSLQAYTTLIAIEKMLCAQSGLTQQPDRHMALIRQTIISKFQFTTV